MIAPLERPRPTMPSQRARGEWDGWHGFGRCGASAATDEVALADWWLRFGDAELNRLVQATIEQGFELCAASLTLQHACADAGDDDDALFSPLCDFYRVRIRQIAITARHYFLALSVQERIACLDAAIAVEAAAARRAQTVDIETAAAYAPDPRPAPLAELHAHRIRLRTQWETVVISLARQTAQPVGVVAGRLHGRGLPAACAETPAIGGPAAMRRRRPDLLALAQRADRRSHESHRSRPDSFDRAQADGGRANDGHLDATRTQRESALETEWAQDSAEKEVELALALLAGAQAELTPVRASLAAAEARYRRLRRAVSGGTGHVTSHEIAEALGALYALRDREIDTRGRTYLALVDVFHAAGCGWPVLAPESAA